MGARQILRVKNTVWRVNGNAAIMSLSSKKKRNGFKLATSQSDSDITNCALEPGSTHLWKI